MIFQHFRLFFQRTERQKEKEKLVENYNALLEAIVKAKPAAAKGQYVKSVALTSTMGPGVKVAPKGV